ncbi:ABC transporter ATP-binding protein [Sulfitobacter alexandrii]|uniref:ABC transporter ATP-binding protein n=1 Tax=Sulfitobacter alexandrii TaxID=1917485 RepID=A0A1J0WJE4_9RHOB|nr:ABC transporter ATP-binding protein [Sulfitobacter alexandrii]APE44441.1 ABC transporter ATP-binding protein [Sulfitobacter alexandrii]
MILSAQDLTGGYGTINVLSDLSFELGEEEVLTVIGRNGVGKTTLMRVLTGHLPKTGGTIRFLDGDTAGMKPYALARAGIGYVPQGRQIFAKLTVEENLLTGMRAAGGHDPDAMEDVLEMFPRLRERLGQMGGTLSGGEQQQLALARALCGKPKVLLLDEPSEGIQPNIVDLIGDLITRIVKERRLSVLLVEQNLNLIRTTAHRCLVMDKGKIVAEGPPTLLDDEEFVARHLAI